MAHYATRLDVRQTSEGRRVQFGIVRGNLLEIEHAGLFVQFFGWVVHWAILSRSKIDASGFNPSEIVKRPTTKPEGPYSRSSARQPMSVRWKPPGQSIFFTAA